MADPFAESYYTLKYSEAKAVWPDTFGLDVAYTAWKSKETSTALSGYTDMTALADPLITLIVQRYEQREIGAETPTRWMWLADRLFTTLCQKYEGVSAADPGFVLGTSEITRTGTTENDLSHTSSDTSGDTHQEYPNKVVPTVSAANTVSGNKQTSAGSTTDTGTVTASETVKEQGMNKVLQWQQVLRARRSLTEAFMDEFDRLFISSIGDDLALLNGDTPEA